MATTRVIAVNNEDLRTGRRPLTWYGPGSIELGVVS